MRRGDGGTRRGDRERLRRESAVPESAADLPMALPLALALSLELTLETHCSDSCKQGGSLLAGKPQFRARLRASNLSHMCLILVHVS